jgi:hypothetical protein
VIDRKRWRAGQCPRALEGGDATLDLAESAAPVAASEAGHAAAVRERGQRVLRLALALRLEFVRAGVVCSVLVPAELLAGSGSREFCPSLEAVGDVIDHCRELYDELQVTLGIRADEAPRFGTRRE